MLALRRWLPVALAGLGVVAFSCSLLVEPRSVQCEKDADCAAFPDAACDLSGHVCVDKSQLGCKKDGDCVCDPKTPTDILNACPRGDCDPFDNARVTKLVDGGLPPPPGAPADAGTTAEVCPTGSGGGGAGGGGGSGGAPAIPVCEEQPAPLYIIGPSSIKPLLRWVAKLASFKDTTIVYQDESSCIGVAKSYDAGSMETKAGHEAYTAYYDPAGEEHACKFVATTVRPHIGLSDVFPQTCGYDLNHADPNVVITPGPVQAMAFIVPKASKQASISAEAAYMVYGFGSASGVAPWTDEQHIFQRRPTSGTQNMIAEALGLKADQFNATLTYSSDQEASLVGCSTEPEKTIGILAVDLVQHGDYPIKVLAYQHFGQDCAYLPDSTAASNDKRNVRDGRYFIWGAIHMLTRKDQPSPRAAELINLISGISPTPDEIDIFDVWSDAHLVPQCAMRVSRKADGGPLEIHHPPTSCYCEYDFVTRGSTDCKKCQTAADCPATEPVCSPYGYCEL